MPFRFFKITENRGVFLILLAIVLPFAVVLPPLSDLHIVLARDYIPWFKANTIGRFFVNFALLGGVFGSILLSTYATLARSISTLTKRLCFLSVAIAIAALTSFYVPMILKQWIPLAFYTSVVLVYVTVLLNVSITSTELGKLYLMGENHTNRNDTVHAWAAFLFSIDLILIVGWLSVGIYFLMKA